MSVGLPDSLASKDPQERAVLLDQLDSQDQVDRGVNKVNGENEDLQVGTIGIFLKQICRSCNFMYISK